MDIQYPFTYFPCQSCEGKIHCDQCRETITAALLNVEGVSAAEVNVEEKWIRIINGTSDIDTVADAMEMIGVFL